MRESFVIATRGSKLALWQAEYVADRLRQAHPDLEVTLLPITTRGDTIQDKSLAAIGGKGLFVREVEAALLDGRAHLAVHSLKDMPAEQPEGLVIGVVPEREDPIDLLLSVRYDGLAALPAGARVGTSSLRRRAQLLALRPDLTVVDLRGNLDTRIARLDEGRFDAIVVAAAGLKRLGLTAPKIAPLAPPDFLPAAAQGALGLEYRAHDKRTVAVTAFLDHRESHDAVTAERAFLARLGGSCQVPIAVHAAVCDDCLSLDGLVAEVTGSRIFRDVILGPRGQAVELGQRLAESVLAKGAGDVLAALAD